MFGGTLFVAVHPIVKKIYRNVLPQVPLAGRLKYFQENWKILTNDSAILDLVQGYKIPFMGRVPPCQLSPPNPLRMSSAEQQIIDQEISNMLEKGAISKATPCKNQFLSTLFIVKKRDGGNRPVINLKRLNCYIPYQHFKMEGLHLIKDLLREGDYMVKLDLKDAYFSLKNESKK